MPKLVILIASSICGSVVMEGSALGPTMQLDGEAGPNGGRIIAAWLWQFIAFQQDLKICEASGLATAIVRGSQPEAELFRRLNSSRLVYLSISWSNLWKSIGSVFFMAFFSKISGWTSCVWQAFNAVFVMRTKRGSGLFVTPPFRADRRGSEECWVVVC